MAMIKQLDKRSGITYVYESTSYWDRDKKQPRSKRTLIGRLDPDSGEVVPTDGRGKRRSIKNLDPPAKRGTVPVTQTERLFFGATYLFDQIGIVTGVTSDLKTCFPHTYKQIQSIAYYLILEDQNPLFRFKKWATLTGMTSPLKGVQSFSSPLQKRQKCGSSACRESDGLKRNTGLMTALPYPVILRV